MRSKCKTLIIFSPAFPTDEEDAWLPWLQTLVMAFNRNFKDVRIVVFAFQYPHTIKTYQWHNNKVIPLNGMHKHKYKRVWLWWKIFKEVKKINKQDQALGILSLWCGECTFLAKYLSGIFRLKYYCWIVGQDARKSNTYVRKIKPKSRSLVAMSDFLMDEFHRNHGIRPAHLIPNGIDVSLFNPVYSAKDVDIIGVGSLSRLKRYDIFINIIAALKHTGIPGIKAVLCGDGEERTNIEVQIEKLNLKDNVYLKGFIKHREGLQWMQRAKILLHPSSYEGFPTVCIEALYAGAHVISFVQPMHHDLPNWHIVKTEEEMFNKALQLLQDDQTNYENTLLHSVDDNAKKFMHLFMND